MRISQSILAHSKQTAKSWKLSEWTCCSRQVSRRCIHLVQTPLSLPKELLIGSMGAHDLDTFAGSRPLWPSYFTSLSLTSRSLDKKMLHRLRLSSAWCAT